MDVSTPEQVDLTSTRSASSPSGSGRRGRSCAAARRWSAVRDHFFGAGEDALEPGQMDTLDLLVQQPAWRMSELAEALRVDPVDRHPRRPAAGARRPGRPAAVGAEDGRVVMVSATDAGRQRHDAIARRRRRSMARMLGEFDPDERRQLAELLERCRRRASTDSRAPTVPPLTAHGLVRSALGR